jgi:hypothetical protein
LTEQHGRTNRRISLATKVAICGVITAFFGILAGILSGDIQDFFIRPPVTPSPTPFCISVNDILVKFIIYGNNDELIATLIPGETFFIGPGLTVHFQAKPTSVYGLALPTPECTWTDTGIATEGMLLHVNGCTVDYQGGRKVITDAVSLQLSQPSCPALAPYPFFISPKTIKRIDP